MPVLHQMAISGNCYKIRLLAHQCGIALTLKNYPLHGSETRMPEFLSKNPNGRVPMLETDDGRFLPESGAILFHLSEGTKFQPEDSWSRAQMLQWMFFEQYSHEPTIAVVRHWVAHLGKTPEKEPALPAKIAGGYRALDVMEEHLKANSYFVGGRYTIADIALYAYTHVAHEGGFDLARYPAINAWLARVAAAPGHIRITD